MKILAVILLLTSLALAQPGGPELEELAPGVWLHKSYQQTQSWGLVLSHGLVIRGSDGVLLVDTAWTNADTEKLLAMAEEKTGQKPTQLVVTHAHQDKIGGLNGFHRGSPQGRSFAHPLTQIDAPLRGFPTASHPLEALQFEGVEVFYPGPGHSRDNIVVYYAPARILFGGCLIRPLGSQDLGNTGDADVGHWATAVRKVRERFPEARIVIPSHGPPAGPEILEHTVLLAELGAFWQKQTEAVAGGDLEALAATYSDQAEFQTLAGGRLRGKKEILTFWRENQPPKMEWKSLELRNTGPGSAFVHGQWKVAEEWGYFLELLTRPTTGPPGAWRVERAYFWTVGEGHTRHLRPGDI